MKKGFSWQQPFQDMTKTMKVSSEIVSTENLYSRTIHGVMLKIFHLKVDELHPTLAQRKSSALRKARTPEFILFIKALNMKLSNTNQTLFVWTRDTLFYGEIMTHREHSYCQSNIECVKGKHIVKVKKILRNGLSESLSFFFTIKYGLTLNHSTIELLSLSLKSCTYK